MSEKKIYVTPKGTSKHAWLLRPDTKFNPDGTYQVNVVLKKEEAKSICKELKALYDAAQKPGKKSGKMPYFVNDDGDVEIKLSQKSVIRLKDGTTFNKTVALVDAKRKPVKVNVGNGSTIKAAFSVRSYDYNGCGISLDLISVQIINLIPWEDQAQDLGFEEEEGFEGGSEVEVEEVEPEQENNFEADDSGDEDDDDSPF